MKATMKILYKEGNADRTKPRSSSIELRRWKSRHAVDYVLVETFITNRQSEQQPLLRLNDDAFYIAQVETTSLDMESDSEAIRIAVQQFNDHHQFNDES